MYIYKCTYCNYTRYQHINMLFCYLALQQSVGVYDYENFDLRRRLFFLIGESEIRGLGQNCEIIVK